MLLISEALVNSTPFSRKRFSCGRRPEDGKHVADDGVRRADAAGALRRVVDDAGIQRKQLIVASAVQRQIFYLAFADQAGNIVGGNLNDAGVRGNFDGLVHVADLQREVDLRALADDERDSGPATRFGNRPFLQQFVVADG